MNRNHIPLKIAQKQNGIPKSSGWNPLSLSPTAKWQCLPNTRFERTVKKLHDPPSARSCIVSHNPDGLFMDSQSHYTKVDGDSWWVGQKVGP